MTEPQLISSHDGRSSDDGGARPRPGRRRPFPFLWAWTAAGAAAALAVVAVFTQGAGGDAGTDGTIAGSGEPVRVVEVSVNEILNGAATQALTLPDITPRADQFLYVRTDQGLGGTHEAWLSIDGRHDGQVVLTGQDPNNPAGKEPIPIDACTAKDCTDYAAYLPDAPTDVDAMAAWLKQRAGKGGDVTNRIAKDIFDLASQKYLRPQARAALFQAAGKIPGIRVVKDVTDAAGRLGIGLTWTTAQPTGTVLPPVDRGSSPRCKGSGAHQVCESIDPSATRPTTPPKEDMVMVFDPKTYAFLGSRYSALEAYAIADRVGQKA